MITPDQIDVTPEYLEAYDHGHRQKWSRRDGIAYLLAYLSNNPIVPTREDVKAIENAWQLSFGVPSVRFFPVEWQRRMFLKREPELPEAIKYLSWDPKVEPQASKHDSDIREAYLLGLKNGGSK